MSRAQIRTPSHAARRSEFRAVRAEVQTLDRAGVAGQNQALLARVRLEQVNRTVVTCGGHQGTRRD